MTRALPPLNALRAFEAAARHLSFKLAADELNVTPAAVSHHVKALEEALGVDLFHRMTRALRLTDAGRAALPALTEGFNKLAEGVDQMRTFRESGLLTVSVSPSFGSMWLVPKLDRFRSRHPDIEIRIDGTDRLVDVAGGEVDVAIRYGPGGYKGLQVDYLFSQLNTPVCSPALMEGDNPLSRPEDLRHHTLLHIDWSDAQASWRMWLLAAGLHDIDATRGFHFTQESMAIEAALDGQGVALVGDRLVAGHLAAGRLVSPFKPDLNTPLNFCYYLLSGRDRLVRPKVAAFRDWLMEEAREQRPDAGADAG
ncbi:transcriptional regulator GcvA [Rhodobium gokarnense]|uniref:LysR family glycine cleavage system transcriptional activator n=1 Tax=Rhodobium gokarnense TaxID=364296 RepID=A0ABT3HFR9_9HYPH|nr:transcriptional regulator GcvA [Rhodobium gokarnense]MCW2309234.1 LysR family glycine cleavage system transcriptional activator [Rhodobium gokarnense]